MMERSEAENGKGARVAVLVRLSPDEIAYMKKDTFGLTNATAVSIYIRKHISAEKGVA